MAALALLSIFFGETCSELSVEWIPKNTDCPSKGVYISAMPKFHSGFDIRRHGMSLGLGFKFRV